MGKLAIDISITFSFKKENMHWLTKILLKQSSVSSKSLLELKDRKD